MKNLVLFLLVVLVSCHSEKETPKDFSFKIENFTDSYDSKTHILQRVIYNSPSEVIRVKVKLSDHELNEIYEEFQRNNFNSLPKILITN